MSTCIFCEIVAGQARATVVHQWANAIAIMPLEPIVAGHTLVIPRAHVRDFTESPAIAADTMHCAAELAHQLRLFPANIITSAGREATQSVFHLHLHIVPRAENDGLALPWYSGRSKRAQAVSP